jgi:hypothetical protein
MIVGPWAKSDIFRTASSSEAGGVVGEGGSAMLLGSPKLHALRDRATTAAKERMSRLNIGAAADKQLKQPSKLLCVSISIESVLEGPMLPEVGVVCATGRRFVDLAC